MFPSAVLLALGGTLLVAEGVPALTSSPAVARRLRWATA